MIISQDRGSRVETHDAPRVPGAAHRLAIVLACWAFAYACYRAYYAFGGQWGMIGVPVSPAQFRGINAAGAGIVAAGAVLPLAALRWTPVRRVLPPLAWLAGVGCVMHAVVDGTLRVLSLTGSHPTQLPPEVWSSFNRRTADLQDLLLNEPWFLVEGLLWLALGMALIRPSARASWIWSAVVACALASTIGVLTGIGVIGAFHLG